MSRYRWPSPGKSKDQPHERLRYNALTDGVLLTDAVIAAHKLRERAPATHPGTRDAPSGDVNLWVPIGPSTVLQGGVGSRPRVAGRVRDLAVSTDGLRVYAATANGGVWYSGDGGTSWSPLGNWLPTPAASPINRAVQSLTCGCLLVNFGAPADGSLDDVYVGTGELVPRISGTPGAKMGGVGVLHLDKPLPAALGDPFGTHWKREATNLAGAGIYRLARDPSNTNHLVAATSAGLFERTGSFVEDADWTQVEVDPFDFQPSDGKRTTDAAWVSTGPGTRLWVALQDDGEHTGVWTSTSGTTDSFDPVVLPDALVDVPGYLTRRLGLAVAPSDPTVVYVLGSGPRLWRISGVAATQVQNVPNDLFGRSSDQSDYDLAIAVHPDNKDIVVLGGSAIYSDDEHSASLFRCTVTSVGAGRQTDFAPANQLAPASDATYIGNYVHADVHQILFKKVGADFHMWVGCDGGVFRSRDSGNRYSFVARNVGLAVLEPGYLASHPDNDAFVVAGTQDNGTLLRVGNTVWMYTDDNRVGGGDGGGVVFHPVKKKFFAAQSFQAIWHSNGNFSPPVLRGAAGSSEDDENSASSFYSGADARRDSVTNQVRLAIGTNRVWLANNWDPDAVGPTPWVVLPPGNVDPRAGASPDTTIGTYGKQTGSIVTCRWVDDSRLLVLMQSSEADGQDSVVLMYTRGTGVTWSLSEISKHVNKCSDYSNGDIDQPTSDYLPPLGAWSDLAVHDSTRGTNGSCYVACTGHVDSGGDESDRMDTLWWYDGASKWYPTGLRTANSPPGNVGTKAPAYAVVCDPGAPELVYVGTGLGVWRGVLTFAGSNPSWAWGSLVNGLPIAAVQDLSLYQGPVKVLRAAIQARGVWEVDVSSAPGPTRRTFLRVHANDARRVTPTSLANPMKTGPANWPWHATPDVRIRPAPLSAGEPIPRPPTAPASPKRLPWNGASPDPFLLWVFQTALHKIDPLCRPTGQWTPQFAARLTALPAAGADVINTPTWNAIVTAANVFSPPWEGADPTEADLFELVMEDGQALDPTVGPPEISRVKRRKYKVDVLVHYRDVRPLAFGSIRVALLRRQLPATQAQWPAIAITPALKTKVVQLMGGGPTPAFPEDGWTVADAAAPTRQPVADIDARLPRGVTFDVNFAGGPAGRRFVVLLAVVHSVPDPVTKASLAGGNLQELLLNCHQVAARVVEIPA